jgi:putative hydrolase
MDRAGAGRVPSAERFSRVLRERRKAASPLAKAFRRLIGLEAKLAQYEYGEQFISAVEHAAGEHAIDVVWQSPDRLPTLAEIKAPPTWLARVGLPGAPALA